MRTTLLRLCSLLWLSVATYALTYKGADFSSLANLEKSGIKYSDSSTGTAAFETILAKHGCNLARIRVWTSTSDSSYSLNYGLALAKRAKAAGMAIMVDLHYSDTWADPAHQAIPSSWPTDLSGLNTKIYNYTNSLVTSFTNQGTPITFIQIGNEINDGLLWPTGRISVNGFDGASQLLHSAVSGVRAASSSVKTMIHLANGWDSSTISWFYGGIFRQGELATADVDIMGFSFYPFYDTRATLANLKSSMNSVISAYGKNVMIVETDWPVSCGATMSEPSIAKSAAGQESWVSQIRSVLSGLSSGRGQGIVYWEPGWVGNAGLGSSCSDALLVNSNGSTRTSIQMFSVDM